MTAKQFVLEKMPEAIAERHVRNDKTRYWLIRNGNNFMWFASGLTESAAWKDAKQRLQNQTT